MGLGRRAMTPLLSARFFSNARAKIRLRDPVWPRSAKFLRTPPLSGESEGNLWPASQIERRPIDKFDPLRAQRSQAPAVADRRDRRVDREWGWDDARAHR